MKIRIVFETRADDLFVPRLVEDVLKVAGNNAAVTFHINGGVQEED